MSQTSFDFPLTEFEKATAEQLVSYKIAKSEKETDASVKRRISAMIKSDKLITEVKALVHKWNSKRIKLGLKPFK
jgi:hypothetical protein